jgi:hypothetical protein
MSTGSFENWAGNISDIGPIYPFVGSEVFWWILGMALWILWHFIQARREDQVYEEEVRKYGDPETLRRFIGEEDPANP